jgi:hypothetical protein
VQTASALVALSLLGDHPCVQSTRAARYLVDATLGSTVDEPPALIRGLGLSPRLVDASAPSRETKLALETFRARGGNLA